MINLKDVYFGCAAAENEAAQNPKVFKKVFFDPHEYLKELIHGHKFLLHGRKGDGKTAYASQIELTKEENNICVCPRSLNNFNNAMFEKLNTYQNFGGNPYISLWKCILMIESVGMIDSYEPNIQNKDFIEVAEILQRHGLLMKGNDISTTVTRLVEKDFILNIKDIFQHSRKYSTESALCGPEQIYSFISMSIKSTYLPKKFILIIDGLDDILLDNSAFRADIIVGLIRAVDELNREFNTQAAVRNGTIAIKVNVLIRDDILKLCRDPNISKIVRDLGIKLSWSISQDDPYHSDLIQLVSKRIGEVTGEENSFQTMWNEIFPRTIDGKDSLSYILENMIYRPRDILQFFVEAQKVFIPGEMLTASKIRTALRKYSEEYFVQAMVDEMTGFFPNEAVSCLSDILARMEDRYFHLEEFTAECASYPEFENVNPRLVLEKLFNAGYLGQHRPRPEKDYTVFSYRNSKESFRAEHECILHRGLMRALTF